MIRLRATPRQSEIPSRKTHPGRRLEPMRARVAGILTLVLLPLGCGGGEAGGDAPAAEAPEASRETDQSPAGAQPASANWVEYSVAGDLAAQGRDSDVGICSVGDEGGLNVAARGSWFMDLEVQGSSPGAHPARFTVTPPDGFQGVPTDVFSRRLTGEGSASIREAGTDAFGLRVLEVALSAPGLASDGGQTISVSGKLSCSVL